MRTRNISKRRDHTAWIGGGSIIYIDLLIFLINLGTDGTDPISSLPIREIVAAYWNVRHLASVPTLTGRWGTRSSSLNSNNQLCAYSHHASEAADKTIRPLSISLQLSLRLRT